MIRIDSEDDGFWITVTDDEDTGGPLTDPGVERITDQYDVVGYRVRIDDPEHLYELVKKELGPWIDEKRDAKAEFDASRKYGYNPDEHGGFEGKGDFNGDPMERHIAHQAAKGNL